MGRIRPNEFEMLCVGFVCLGCGAQRGEWCRTRYGNFVTEMHESRAGQARRYQQRAREKRQAG